MINDNSRVGIIMAGGNGTRLYPLSKVINKHLLPVYDKPMIYYPLSTLIRFGHKLIYLISTRQSIPLFKRLLGDGGSFGVKIIYKIQDKPRGIANCFHILKNKIKNKKTTLILGDNLFISNFENLVDLIDRKGATLVCTHVKNPKDYGVVDFQRNTVKKITEKPSKPKSNLISTGLYFYDENLLTYLNQLKPSKRGEYEIADLNNIYIKKNQCNLFVLKSTDSWYDLGQIDDLNDCSTFLRVYQKKRNLNFGNL